MQISARPGKAEVDMKKGFRRFWCIAAVVGMFGLGVYSFFRPVPVRTEADAFTVRFIGYRPGGRWMNSIPVTEEVDGDWLAEQLGRLKMQRRLGGWPPNTEGMVWEIRYFQDGENVGIYLGGPNRLYWSKEGWQSPWVYQILEPEPLLQALRTEYAALTGTLDALYRQVSNPDPVPEPLPGKEREARGG